MASMLHSDVSIILYIKSGGRERKGGGGGLHHSAMVRGK